MSSKAEMDLSWLIVARVGVPFNSHRKHTEVHRDVAKRSSSAAVIQNPFPSEVSKALLQLLENLFQDGRGVFSYALVPIPLH